MKRFLAALMLTGLLAATLVTVPGGLWLPRLDHFASSSSSFPIISTTWGPLSVDGYKVGYIVQAPKTGTLGQVRIYWGSVTKDATTTLKVSFQDVVTNTGYPDETIDQYRVVPNGDIVAGTMPLTGLITSDGTDGGAKRSVTAGDYLAVVLEFSTFVAGDSISPGSIGVTGNRHIHQNSYLTTKISGWSKEGSRAPLIMLEYDDASTGFAPSLFPWSGTGTQSFNNTSSSDEYGIRFQVPFAGTLGGCWLALDYDGPVDIVLYTASGATTVASLNYAIRQSTTPYTYPVMFTAAQAIVASTNYVLAVKPTSSTNVTVAYVDYPATNAMDQFNTQNWLWASAKDPTVVGDFSTTALRQGYMGLIFTQVHDGAGGGSPSAAMPTVISH